MNETYHIQISRADNGYIVATSSDVPGQKPRRLVGMTPKDIQEHVTKVMLEDAFAEPPKVEETKTEQPVATFVPTIAKKPNG